MIYISIGSNLGDRINNLRYAEDLLTKRYLQNTRSSIVLETSALLPKKFSTSWNKPFLNMIIAGETNLSPKELLEALKNIEVEMGRPTTREKWAPRIIDLDILLWENLKTNTSTLTIPHPELNNRHFLQHLLSLMEVEPWKTKHAFTAPFANSFTLHPSLVGVVNVTDDSFSDGGKFNDPSKAVDRIYQLAKDGASIIEIGAQSTRPGAILQTTEEEYKKLKSVLDKITSLTSRKTIRISIDTFHSSIALKLLEDYKISWINDVKGDFDDKSLQLLANAGCKFCFTHSLGVPPRPDKIMPLNQSPINLIKEWGKRSIDRLLKLGFSLNSIILDPGIGFGKSLYQNIEILRHIEELKEVGVPIMSGHSRKSYIKGFSLESADKRDIETIAISLFLKDKVDFLRIHNVKDHMRALVAHEVCSQGKVV